MCKTFNPEEHICKFGFNFSEFLTDDAQTHNICCDLYQKEIIFEFINKRTDETEEAIGFELSDSDISELLPLIKWDKYERYRSLPDGWQWDFKNGYDGYRDGWYYKFWCLSESGYPLFQMNMDVCFVEDKLPPYEKLFMWVINKYTKKKELKNRCIFW